MIEEHRQESGDMVARVLAQLKVAVQIAQSNAISRLIRTSTRRRRRSRGARVCVCARCRCGRGGGCGRVNRWLAIRLALRRCPCCSCSRCAQSALVGQLLTQALGSSLVNQLHLAQFLFEQIPASCFTNML